MHILLDHSAPAPIGKFLAGHIVSTAAKEGWDLLSNGTLLKQAETSGFNLFITSDQNIKDQQNLANRKIAIIAINTNSLPIIRTNPNLLIQAVNTAAPGSYQEVNYPKRQKVRPIQPIKP